MQAFKSDMTHIASCRNVIIATNVRLGLFFLLFGQFCRLEKGRTLYS